uniref:Uncharacterized protein n=1 Tax=Globodera pallida TaxID=36090 RepID=A0A183C823_GLOPA
MTSFCGRHSKVGVGNKKPKQSNSRVGHRPSTAGGTAEGVAQSGLINGGRPTGKSGKDQKRAEIKVPNE